MCINKHACVGWHYAYPTYMTDTLYQYHRENSVMSIFNAIKRLFGVADTSSDQTPKTLVAQKKLEKEAVTNQEVK
ncbi:MAG TPA: hypothetical protein EYH38_01470 [Leucothrix sp.]|nr:hypothetical protein [Leucothrix sp.]HIQ14227.1 hypothetical protein [Leucothrix sp.]